MNQERPPTDSRTPERVSYFSNSTDGEQWMGRWCYRCAHDHNFHGDDPPQTDPCISQMSLYLHEQNDTFIYTPVTITMASGRTLDGHTWECINFTRCSCDNGPDDPGVEPPPTPDPNQLALFETEGMMPGVYRDVVLDTFETVDA